MKPVFVMNEKRVNIFSVDMLFQMHWTRIDANWLSLTPIVNEMAPDWTRLIQLDTGWTRLGEIEKDLYKLLYIYPEWCTLTPTEPD